MPRGTIANKILGNKTFDIAKNSKYDGYQRGLASMIFLIRRLLRLQINLLLKQKKETRINSETKELVKGLNKPISKKFEKEKYIHLL